MTAVSCLDPSAASQFVEGVIDSKEIPRIEAHLADCAECRELLIAIVSADESDFSLAKSDTQKPSKWASSSSFLGSGAEVGRFVIRERLGRGGMGVVYRAHDHELERDVAVKLLRFDYEDERAAEAEARFLREARAMARLSHPNVVTVFEVGSESGYVFIAMELLLGETLGKWLAKEARSVDEIVRAFAGAGKGLAAAHRAGLIHRDFKPSNVIVIDAGHAVVVDFGLVGGREFADEGLGISSADADADPDSISSGSLTRTGTILGTPAYMAPEQHHGEPLGPFTDQWAFAACLYEALTEKHPFAASDLETLRKRVLSGTPEPLSKKIPARVRRATMRGLARDEKSRFPGMSEMVRAIEGSETRVWRRSAAVGLVAAALTALVVVNGSRGSEICSGGKGRVAEIWNNGIASDIRERFVAAALPFSDRTASEVSANLDAYFDRWTTLHRETCQAARVRKELSEDAMERSMACLDRRLEEARALLPLLRNAERDVVAKAEDATRSLSDLDSCRDQSRLLAIVPEPSDPETQGKLRSLRAGLAAIKAHLDLGQPREGLRRVAPLREQARAITFAGARAELEYWRGRALEANGKYAAAEAPLAESAYAAISMGDARRLVLSATALVIVATRKAELKEAEQWQRIAAASLAQLGGDTALSRRLNAARAKLLGASGDHAAAKRITEQLLASLAAEFGAGDVRAADAHRDLSKFCNALYDHKCGREHAERSVAIWTAHHGPEHPAVGGALITSGNAAAKQRQYDEALGQHRRAVAITERALGSEHPEVALAYQFLCYTLVATGNNAEAIAACARSLAITRATLGPDHPRIARVTATMAYVNFKLKKFDESYRLDKLAMEANSATLGRKHLWIADAHRSLGRTRQMQGRHAEAAVHIAQAVEIRRSKLGSNHKKTVRALMTLGIAYFDAGDAKRATPILEEAFERSANRLEEDKDFRRFNAESGFQLAKSLWADGRSKRRARELATAAIADYLATGEDESAAAAKRWLAGR